MLERFAIIWRSRWRLLTSNSMTTATTMQLMMTTLLQLRWTSCPCRREADIEDAVDHSAVAARTNEEDGIADYDRSASDYAKAPAMASGRTSYCYIYLCVHPH